jgi:predicted nucleic acid-binding Zn ribbon protein
MMNDRKRKPVPIAEALSGFLSQHGIARRLEQTTAIEDWPKVVGEQIAGVTKALSITPDGVLFVAVSTHAWMTELGLMEPELLAALNTNRTRDKVRKIRYRLDR